MDLVVEKALKLEYGVAGICVLLTIFILLKVGEIFWSAREKKESLTDETLKEFSEALQENTFELKNLTFRFSELELMVGEFPKIKTDMRKFYNALRFVAGDKWSKIREEILDDDLFA